MAVLDKNKIDKKLVAFTNVQLKEHAISAEYEKDIVVEWSDGVSPYDRGSYDYLLKIVVKDMKEVSGFSG